MIAAFDVQYHGNGATAAGVWFRDGTAAVADHRITVSIPAVAEYEPGAFYRRELPCLLAALAAGPHAELHIIDGYVWLEGGAPGLGAKLFEVTGVPVIGVGKTRYAGAAGVVETLRGGSRVPLFVSAVGTDVADAAEFVRTMHGPFRMPTLLKEVDSLARRAVNGERGASAPWRDTLFPSTLARQGADAPRSPVE